MIVADASAAVSALLNDGAGRHAFSVEQIHVPHLIDSEVTNALRRHVTAGRLAPDVAWDALRRWCRLGLTRYPGVGLLDRIWELRENVSAYDASYLALAERLGCALMAADARLGRTPGIGCVITVVPQ